MTTEHHFSHDLTCGFAGGVTTMLTPSADFIHFDEKILFAVVVSILSTTVSRLVTLIWNHFTKEKK